MLIRLTLALETHKGIIEASRCTDKMGRGVRVYHMNDCTVRLSSFAYDNPNVNDDAILNTRIFGRNSMSIRSSEETIYDYLFGEKSLELKELMRLP